MKKSRSIFTVLLTAVVSSLSLAQNNTFSPYSRYGLGEMSQITFAHNTGMAGTHIALKIDSISPVFINTGNPASYALLRITALEVGGRFQYSAFKGPNTAMNKWTTNFSYGSIGFPVRSNGGMAFGIMPFSDVGYQTQSYQTLANVGEVLYDYAGNGGFNKAFIGYGMMPFHNQLNRFRRKNLYRPDSLRRMSNAGYRVLEFGAKLVSDFNIGANVNYVFGSAQNNLRVVYPNSLLYNNTYREHVLTIGDFTGNFGAQTAITIDSIADPKRRVDYIDFYRREWTASETYTAEQLQQKLDSITKYAPNYRKQMRERVKFVFGYTGNIQNPLKASYSSAVYNYILNSSGQELIRDTAVFNINQSGTVRLPIEQGFGLAFKKGERISIAADYAITDWSSFRYLDEPNNLLKNYRVSAGINFVPDKYANGTGIFFKTINYRFGASYQSGFLKQGATTFTDAFVSLGAGMPVGINRRSAMVNVSLQLGRMGLVSDTQIKQNYLRVNFGFTFCDRWFQKYRYD